MSAPDEGEGTGHDLQSAAQKAVDDAEAKGNGKGWYEIKKIEVKTESPISEYRVKVKKV